MQTPDVTVCIFKQYHPRGSVVMLNIITSVLQLEAEYNHAMPTIIVIITTLSFVSYLGFYKLDLGLVVSE